MQPGDLSGVDERFVLSRHQAAEPLSESIGKQVGEAVERGIVVVGPALKRRCSARQRTPAAPLTTRSRLGERRPGR